jgi:hypothetical protein
LCNFKEKKWPDRITGKNTKNIYASLSSGATPFLPGQRARQPGCLQLRAPSSGWQLVILQQKRRTYGWLSERLRVVLPVILSVAKSMKTANDKLPYFVSISPCNNNLLKHFIDIALT